MIISIKYLLGEFRNGIRGRAQLCVTCDLIHISTLICTKAQRISDVSKHIIHLSVVITPSMKAAQYCTTLMFDVHNHECGSSPYSGCDCPDDQLICSQMLVFLQMVMLIQEESIIKFNIFKAIPPNSILDIQICALM